MNVPVSQLDTIADAVNYKPQDYIDFLHKTQEAGFFKDYPKPNARRKRVPYQKPEVGVNGVTGPYAFEQVEGGVGFYEVLTKRGYRYTVRKDETRKVLKNQLDDLALIRLSLIQKAEELGIDFYKMEKEVMK